MSTCSHRTSSSLGGARGGGGSGSNNNGIRRFRNKNRISCCEQSASANNAAGDEDVEFSEVIEKILLNVNAVFEKDDLLDEFDIIPEESQSNRSPVYHVDHKLAFESWCVPFLYQHSLNHFITTIIVPNEEKLRAKRNATAPVSPSSAAYSNGNAVSLMSPPSTSSASNKSADVVVDLNPTCKSCSKQINTAPSQPKPPPPQLTEIERIKRGQELTRILLLINPDLSTAWNFRRDLFLNKRDYFELSLTSELKLVSLVCSRKPKCLEAFNYRRWLCHQHLCFNSSDMDSDGFEHDFSHSIIWRNPVTFFQNEMKFVENAASKYSSNYHAWTYRSYLLSTFAGTSSQFPQVTREEEKQAILDMELISANNWLQSHISDHSGFHFRQLLLLEICNHYQKKKNLNRIIKFYMEELNENFKMIQFYIGHESLWYHRRAILKQILNWLHVYSQNELEYQQQPEFQSSEASKEVNDLKSVATNIYLDEKRLVEQVRSEQIVVSSDSSSVFNNSSSLTTSNKNNMFDQTQQSKQLNLLYAQRHSKWCQYSFNWTI